MDIEKLRKRYQGPMMNQDIMDCIAEIERLKTIIKRLETKIKELIGFDIDEFTKRYIAAYQRKEK